MSVENSVTAGIVAAGGIGATESTAGLPGTDKLTARAYGHPALGERVVVRLTTETLGQAEDQAAEFLGLRRVTEPSYVGIVRQQALGFPAWALVHDPANGRHALAMVKELERLARLAKSKPGNAELGYMALASTLDSAAPHFLPTFWEQAGRAYVAADNSRQASMCFNRARVAERTHALPVDEVRLAEVHLEFALRGALTAKALTEYGRDLASRLPAAEAFQQFSALARQRVGGGLPPHAGLADDLKRLARAAGHKPDAELERFVADVIWMPSIVKATIGFWTSFVKPLTRLVAQDPRVRVRLLSMVPGTAWTVDVSDEWIGFLIAVGASPALPDPADASTFASDWLDRLTHYRQHHWARNRSAALVALIKDMAPRLRAEGRPVVLGDHARQIDLDLLDVCLQERIPVTPPMSRRGFDLDRWLKDQAPGRRDLLAISRDPVFGVMLRRGVEERLRDVRFGSVLAPWTVADLSALVRAPGIRAAVADWLTENADRAAEGTLVTLNDVLRRTYPLHSGPGMALAPEASRRLVSVDSGQALALTLRGGLPEEYAWDAYTEAVSRLDAVIYTDVCWPYVVVWDQARAVVVGPKGIVLEHAFHGQSVNRPWESRATVSFVDGELFVSWSTRDGRRAYWSGHPDDAFDYRDQDDSYPGHRPQHRAPTAIDLGNGVTTGGKPWRVGDRRAPTRLPVATDPTGAWRCEMTPAPSEPTWHWREYNPTTGAGGRQSQPAFFDVAGLIPNWSAINPAPTSFAGSPLGYSDGMVGWRVWTDPDGFYHGEGIDGRTATWQGQETHDGRMLAGAVTLPGADGVRAVTVERDTVEIWTADGSQPSSRAKVGTYCPPVDLWHALMVRDEAGSAALRGMTDALAARMIAALDGVAADARLSKADAAVAEHLPAVSDLVLRRRVAIELVQARQAADQLVGLRDFLDEQVPPVQRAVIQHGGFSVFRTDLTGDALATVLAQIRTAGEALAGRDPEPTAFTDATHNVDWPFALTVLPALSARALSVGTDVDERVGIIAVLHAVAETGLVSDRVRMVRARCTVRADAPMPHSAGTTLRLGPQRFAIVLSAMPGARSVVGERRDLVRLLERSVDGEFGPIEGYTITEDLRFGHGDLDWLKSIVDRIDQDGPLPWRPELADHLAAVTSMTRAEAVLLLAGLPDLYGKDGPTLTAATRKHLGLTVPDVKAARKRLSGCLTTTLLAVLQAGTAGDAQSLWRDGPDIEQMAEVWRTLVNRADEDPLTSPVHRLPHVGGGMPVRQFAAPHTHPWLTKTELNVGERLCALAISILWFAYHLPVSHPVRAGLPTAYRLIREILGHPTFAVAAHGPPVDPGLPALRMTSQTAYMSSYELRTQLITGPDDPVLRLTDRPEIGVLLTTSVAALMASIEADDTARGEWPQNPQHSVPDLVDAVSDQYQLDADTAGYYLQLLALPDPSDANVMRWNSWGEPELLAARNAIAATPLVLRARRERAGRDLFLPGGWLPQREPSLPLERWKSGLLRLRGDDSPVLDVILVDRPVLELFRVAWQLVLDGKGPRYATLGERR